MNYFVFFCPLVLGFLYFIFIASARLTFMFTFRFCPFSHEMQLHLLLFWGGGYKRIFHFHLLAIHHPSTRLKLQLQRHLHDWNFLVHQCLHAKPKFGIRLGNKGDSYTTTPSALPVRPMRCI